jgi:hypothetical protein
VMDNDNLGWTFNSLHFQSELLLDCGKERWRGVRIAEPGIVIGPLQAEIVVGWEGCLIYDGTVDIEIHVESEVGHRRIGKFEYSPAAAATVPSIVPLVWVGNLEDRSTFRHSDRINRQLTYFPMEDQVEAVGEKFLIHLLQLQDAGVPGRVGNPIHIISIFVEPFRRTPDLLYVNRIGDRENDVFSHA